ncbi:signal peptidase II [Paracoccaceae bacterium]|nr:signal peptidase II [Paracoccaceae bacterium]
MTRYATLVSLLTFSIFSALVIRGILSASDLNGQNFLGIGIVSLNLEYTVNTGINFGLAGDESSSRQIKLAALAIVICIAIIIWGIRSPARWTPVIAGLFAGGGFANALERILYDGVFDYLNISFIFYKNPYSFNLADIYIFVAALLFIFRPSSD